MFQQFIKQRPGKQLGILDVGYVQILRLERLDVAGDYLVLLFDNELFLIGKLLLERFNGLVDVFKLLLVLGNLCA
jgi:hypothetical protein